MINTYRKNKAEMRGLDALKSKFQVSDCIFLLCNKSTQTQTKLLLRLYQDLWKGKAKNRLFYVYKEKDYSKTKRWRNECAGVLG